jgi:hypothetical protein
LLVEKQMLILALDLGTHCGWCRGTSDIDKPRGGVINLAEKGPEPADCILALYGFLQDVNLRGIPDLVVHESPMAINALMKLQRAQNEDSMRLPFQLQAIVWLWCKRNNVESKDVSPLTYRKHFIGKASAGTEGQSKDQKRLETKKAMLRQAKMIGYIGRDRNPTRVDATDPLYDLADAFGLWDYAAAVWGRRRPAELFMHGETV